MVTNTKKICSASYFYLHNIRRIRKFVSVESTKLLVHALVTSRIDYCNSLLYGLPQTQLSKLQRVQNTAARLICKKAGNNSRSNLGQHIWVSLERSILPAEVEYR